LAKSHSKEFKRFLDLQKGKQPVIPYSLDSLPYLAGDQHQQAITTEWARAFAGNSLAHSLIESPLFRQALKTMDRRYVPPARDGMKQQIIAQSELLEQKMHEIISATSKLSLCVDLWTKQALTQSFVGITAHFIDKSRRQPVRLLLTVKEILGKHNAENIAKTVREALSESQWTFPQEKIRCIVTDNGSNIVKAFHEYQETVIDPDAVEELYLEPADPNLEAELDEFDAEEAHFVEFGRDKRLPCFAHSLVCALKASIEKSPIYNTILNLATAVVTAFTQSASKFGLLFNLTGKRFVRPVRTRWLFAYYMLDRLLELRTHVDFIIENELLDVGLTPNQWRQAELLCMFLKDFANQVTELEGEKYVTLNRIIPALMDLLEHCKEFEQQQGFAQIARVLRFAQQNYATGKLLCSNGQSIFGRIRTKSFIYCF
jgi:hypothetical protein